MMSGIGVSESKIRYESYNRVKSDISMIITRTSSWNLRCCLSVIKRLKNARSVSVKIAKFSVFKFCEKKEEERKIRRRKRNHGAGG